MNNRSSYQNWEKSFVFPILLLTLLLCASCSSSPEPKSRGIWLKDKNTYIDIDRNLQWSLPYYMLWHVTEEYRLPENALFTASNHESNSVVVLVAIPIEKGLGSFSIWDYPDEFIDGMISSFTKQAVTLPGITYSEPQIKKVHYLFKEALQVTVSTKVDDVRFKQGGFISYNILMYVFILHDEVIMAMAICPQTSVRDFGINFNDLYLENLEYIDASKEASHL